MVTKKTKTLIKEILFSMLAAVVAAININTFINAGSLVPGGFSGISLLIQRIGRLYNIEINYSILYLAFNIPCVFLVYKNIGRRFTLISLIDVVLTSILVEVIPTIAITDDPLLVAIFGGILGGVSSTLVVSANACGGGTDFITIYMAKKRHASFWTQAMMINVTVICISGMIFGWEASLYSIIFQYVQTQVLNTTDNRYHRSTFFVVTKKADEINAEIIKEMHRSVTILDGIGGYSQQPMKLMMVICGDYEAEQLSELVMKIDPKAFINVTKSSKILGNFHEKPY